MKRLVSLLLSCLLLSSCGTIVTPAKTPPEHLVSEAPPAQVLPAPGEMPELLPDSQEAGGENASEPSPEEGGGTPVETLPEPQRVVDPTRPMVALTFDDGPHAVYTDQILDILEEHGAVATFFEVARNLPKAPEAVRRAADMGCEIGSHTQNHADLVKADADTFRQQIQQADENILKAIGRYPYFLRPPYGDFNDDVRRHVGKPLAFWSVDTKDWKTRNTACTVSAALNNIEDGDVVLMHDIYGETADAVAQIVPSLVQQGYQLVTVSELIQLRFGDEVEPNRTYNYDYFRFQVPPLPAETVPAAA